MDLLDRPAQIGKFGALKNGFRHIVWQIRRPLVDSRAGESPQIVLGQPFGQRVDRHD